VLVVRIGIGQLRDVGMFKRIIPGQPFTGTIDFITLTANASSLKVDEFPDIQGHIVREDVLSFEFGQRSADGRQSQGRAQDPGITLLKRIDKYSVGLEIR
jgi:hypothetical protein